MKYFFTIKIPKSWRAFCYLLGLLGTMNASNASFLQTPYSTNHPVEVENLPTRVQAIISREKEKFTSFLYYPYQEEQSLFFVKAFLSFAISIYAGAMWWQGYTEINSAEKIYAWLRSYIGLFVAYLLVKEGYQNLLNSGAFFLTDRGVLIIEPGDDSIKSQWIPYESIEHARLSHDKRSLKFEVIQDFEQCYLYDIEEHLWKRKKVTYAPSSRDKVDMDNLYLALKENMLLAQKDLILKKIKQDDIHDPQVLPEKSKSLISEAKKKEVIPKHLQAKIQTLLKDPTTKFTEIDSYYPYFSLFSGMITVTVLSFIASLAILLSTDWTTDNLNEELLTYMLLMWACALIFGISSYGTYKEERNCGGWFLTDTGILIIKKGEALQHKFLLYEDIKAVLFNKNKSTVSFLLKHAHDYELSAASIYRHVIHRFFEDLTKKITLRKKVHKLKGYFGASKIYFFGESALANQKILEYVALEHRKGTL